MKYPSSTFPRNARFWVTNRGCGLVRITLRPGQILRYSFAWDNGEGTSLIAEEYEHEGQRIARRWCSSGSDCDGFHRETGGDYAALNELAAVPVFGDEQYSRPDWKDAVPEHVHDEFAATANY